MNDTQSSASCPNCGSPLPPESPQALCPACLLRQALASRTMGGEKNSATSWPPPSPEEIAGKFPQFHITECLGRGGMGVVYKARQRSLDRWVAIKILAPERVGQEKFAERFTREAQTLARLNHPNIITVFDYGETGGLYYIVMEFLDGVNLRDLLRDGKIEPKQALAIVPPICDALQYAHDRGIVHRDIKPENLLLDREGRVKIADFGIAALAGAANESAGTPPYVAPEQSLARSEVDHRADIYALGVVLYEMLTGERPASEVIAPSRKVQIDVRLDEVVLRALEKKPELRYQQASGIKDELETIIQNEPSSIRPPAGSVERKSDAAFPESSTRNIRGKLKTYALAAGGTLLVVFFARMLLGVFFALWLGFSARMHPLAPAQLADQPAELRKLPTARVIEAGLAKPLSAWPWAELENRPLTAEDGAKILGGLTSWLEQGFPDGFTQPLPWLDRFLEQLAARKLVSDEAKIHFLQIFHGKLRGDPLFRLRENRPNFRVHCEWSNPWEQKLFGMVLLNEMRTITIDGKAVKPPRGLGSFWNMNSFDENLQLPALAPGKHVVKLEVLSALVPENDVQGLASDAASPDWPPAKARWTRSAQTELMVYPKGEAIVTRTTDPKQDPVAVGGLSVVRAVLRPKGKQVELVLQFDLNEKLPGPISFDVTASIGGQAVPCRQLWAAKKPDGQLESSETLLITETHPPDSRIQEVNITLTPNEEPMEGVSTVKEIWGLPVHFNRVPLVRQDLQRISE